MQLDLSSEGTEPASHVVQLGEPYAATWFAAHATQAPSTIACPGSHLTQRVRSSAGALPAPHTVHSPALSERSGPAAWSPPAHGVHAAGLPPADHVAAGHPSHLWRSLANSPAAQAGGGVSTTNAALRRSTYSLTAVTRTE